MENFVFIRVVGKGSYGEVNLVQHKSDHKQNRLLSARERRRLRQSRENQSKSDDSSGPAKLRRAVEHLRTDVVKGFEVKLLDKVLDIMQEEDEDKREVLLWQQMGEEKYKTHAVMVRQLKIFEDV